MRGRFVSMVAVGALVLTTAVAVTTPASAATGPVGTVDWKPCADAQGVDCGTVTVPINWADKNGPTIQIALARRKATDPAARIGSILMDPGGPGGSGVDEVKQGWGLSPEITRRFDTVGFDPRGVGDSHPVTCDGSVPGASTNVVPASQKEFDQLVAYNKALAASCRKLTGPLIDFVDTKSVVRDMDAIRAALGEQKLTYYGVSYGTLMGEQYAETFPTHIRALVLDSNMDHSQRTTWGFLRSESKATQQMFEQFGAWCDRTPECALHGRDIPRLFAGLYAKAAAGKLTDPADGQPISSYELINLVSGAGYGPSWAQLASSLKSLADGTKAVEPPSSRAASKVTPTAESFQAIFCEDWSLPLSRFAELDGYRKALAAATAPDVKFSPLGMSAVLGCAGWPIKASNPQHELSVHGAPPILMLNSRYDPVTPYEWAKAVSQQSGAVLLTYDGWGHGAYKERSACVTNAADTYLITGKTPRWGTHCPAVEPPVTPDARTRSAIPEPAVPRW